MAHQCQICGLYSETTDDFATHWMECHLTSCIRCDPSHCITLPCSDLPPREAESMLQDLMECFEPSVELWHNMTPNEADGASCTGQQGTSDSFEPSAGLWNNATPNEGDYLYNFVDDATCSGQKRASDGESDTPTAKCSRNLLRCEFDRINLKSYRDRYCPLCDYSFEEHGQLHEHFYTCHPQFYTDHQVGYGNPTTDSTITHVGDLHNGAVSAYSGDLKKSYDSVDELFRDMFPPTEKIVEHELVRRKGLKIFFSIKCHFSKPAPDGTLNTTIAGFTSFAHVLLHRAMIGRTWDVLIDQMDSQIEGFTCLKSGWNLDLISDFRFVIATYKPLRGGTYIELPSILKYGKRGSGILNIDNSVYNIDPNVHNKCFLYSILAHEDIAGLPPSHHRSNHDKKVESYTDKRKWKVQVKDDGIRYPMTLEQIPKWERMNPTIGLTIIAYECNDTSYSASGGSKKRHNRQAEKDNEKKVYETLQKQTYLLHNTVEKRPIQVDLLLLIKDGVEHYCLIRNLPAFLRRPGGQYTRQICRNCLQGFTSEVTLSEHSLYCAARGLQKTTYPDYDLKFDQYQRTQPVAFRFYGDFEALLPLYDENNLDEMERKLRKKPEGPTSTTRLQSHNACGYGWVCIDHEGNRREGKSYRITHADENVAERFVTDIIECTERLEVELMNYQDEAKKTMVIDPVVMAESVRQNKCCFCKEMFLPHSEIVRHHSHLPPFNFVGLAHNECNLSARLKFIFPVFIHNLQNYDMHYLVRALENLKRKKVLKKVEVIPKSTEKFLSMTINNNIRFLDSAQFTLSSLEKLVENMAKGGTAGKFKITRQEFENDGGNVELLFQKGAYPYSLMRTMADFDRTSLPTKEEFFNDLTERAIEDDVYEHAQQVWESFNIQNMGEWMLLYVRLDTSLLADVMEDVRSLMWTSFDLDISHYFSLPMYSWDAMLKMTGVKLELIKEPNLFLFFESAVRGGYVSVGSIRACSANNAYMQGEYNPDVEDSYIMYIDANNLYGWSMSQPLPLDGIKWVSKYVLSEMRVNPMRFVKNLAIDEDVGYMMEVDLHIPVELHSKFNAYPPCPVKRCVEPQELSTSYQLPLMQDLLIKPSNCQKLVADLYDKKRYIVHYRALQSYLAMGVQITKVHNAAQFNQSCWMKPYIDFNTRQRKVATSEFAKNFWKLLNNAAFGKTIESVRERQNVVIVTSEEQALAYIKKPTVQLIVPITRDRPKPIKNSLVSTIIPIDTDVSIFLMKKLNVTLNKPIHIGVAVLDISKSLMYDTHYNEMMPKFPKAQLVYTDTDSLIYHIPTQRDLYRQMMAMPCFDMSDYDPQDPLYGHLHDAKHKKVLGKFKDEFCNAVITHIAAPRPKMYGIRSLKLVFEEEEEGRKIYKKKNSDGTWPVRVVESKKAKGIGKVSVQNHIPLLDYSRVLESSVSADGELVRGVQTYAPMKNIASCRHRVYTQLLVKKALNGLDTKRYCVDSINTLALGHVDTELYQ